MSNTQGNSISTQVYSGSYGNAHTHSLTSNINGYSVTDSYASRMNMIEKRLTNLEEFLEYKGITAQEFKDFIDSRELAQKMARTEENKIYELSPNYVFTASLPTNKILLSLDSIKNAVKSII